MHNIDIRYNFPFNGTNVALVVVGNEGDGSLNFYTVNPSTLLLEARGSYKLASSAPYGGVCIIVLLAANTITLLTGNQVYGIR